MATKPIICPKDCEDKHSEHRVTMAKIFGKLDNIESKLEDNSRQHIELIESINGFRKELENKADKQEVKDINTKLWFFIMGIGSLLMSISAYFIVKWIESH